MNSCGTSSVGLKPFTTANPASHPNGLPGDLQEGMVITAIQTIMPRKKLSAGSVDTSLGHMGTAQNLFTTPVELPALMKAGGWHLSRIPASYTRSQAAGGLGRFRQGAESYAKVAIGVLATGIRR